MESINVFGMVYKHRMNKKGEVPLVICVTLNRKPIAYDNLKRRILLTDWDESTRELKPKAPNALLINALLNKRIAELDGEFTKSQIFGKLITKKTIKDEVAGKKPTTCFYQFCDNWLPQKYKNSETIRAYRNEVTKLKRYQAHLDFADITFDFLSQYKSYLIDNLGNAGNTIWKTFKFMNTMILDGIKHGCLEKADNPFLIFDRGKYKDPENPSLELDDCEALEKLIIRTDIPEMVKRVAIYFLLMAYSGLRFEDAINFDPDVNVIGDKLICNTSKFGVTVRMKIYPRLKNIITSIISNRISITNQQFNKWLKVAFALAGLPEKMASSHKGRHLFGSTLAEAGVSTEISQKLLGHKDINSTKTYYHIKNKALDSAIDKIDNLITISKK